MLPKTVAGFEVRPGNVPLVVMHTFEATSDGQLQHSIDGRVRATVPPEGWKDYCLTFPEARDIVDSLTLRPNAISHDPVAEIPATSGDAPDAGGA